MLQETQINEIRSEITEIENSLELITETQAAKRQETDNLRDQIKDLTDQIDNMTFERHKITDYLRSSRQEYDALLSKSIDLKKQLEEDAFEKEVVEAMKHHPDFWSEVESRIKSLHEDLDSNFVELIDPAAAVDRLRKESERLTFGGTTYTIGQNKGAYERLLRDLVVKQINGKTLELPEIRHLSSHVNHFLELPQIRPYWIKT